MRISRIVGCFLATLGFLAGGASALDTIEFSAHLFPQADITGGPDGNVWFTDGMSGIGRITPDGVVTTFTGATGCSQGPYPLPPGTTSITAGPDGNLWFTEWFCGRIGRITPLGVVTEFGSAGKVLGIAAGPDGNLWFTDYSGNTIGRITPTGVMTKFSVGITAGAGLHFITAGPDGNVWFTEPLIDRIGRITPAGVVTEFSTGITPGARPNGITAGLDGNVWFTEQLGNMIGRITPTGAITEFSNGISAGAVPYSITNGPDGNLWFTEYAAGRIGRITPVGVVSEFGAGIKARSRVPDRSLTNITAGPDGSLWFTAPYANGIGRITPCQGACLPTAMTLVSSDNPSQPGLVIVFTASVAGTFPTGTVQFMDGGVPLGSPVGLSGGGIAQFMTSSLARGKHEITAVYSGDGNNAPSTSDVLVQTVGRSRHRGG